MEISDKGPTGLPLRTIYITQPGYCVSAHSHHLTFRFNKKQIGKIPILQVRNIVIMDGVALTSGTISECLKMDIPVTFMSRDGNLSGHLLGSRKHDASPRIAQMQAYLNRDTKLMLCRKFTKAKLSNTIAVLRKHMYNHKENCALSDLVLRIKSYRDRIDLMNSEDEIRGLEGITAKEYFGVFGDLIRKTFTFSGREKRPPKDPVNAMLSLGYTIIAQEMSSLAEAVGLDSYIGFLHELKAGRPSLGLDMIEPLRNPVIDRFVLNLINLGMIGYDDFEESAGTGGAVLLNIEGRKKFFGAYEKWMQSLTTDMTESLWAPRPQIERECLTFKKALLAGTIADWEPYTFK